MIRNQDFALLKDEQRRVLVALAAAGATVHSVSLDLGATNVGAALMMGHFIVPPLPSLVDAKTVIVTLEDSADNSSFSTVAAVPPLTLTGAGGIGNAGAVFDFPMPPTVRRYVRITEVTLAAGGNNTAVNAEFYISTRIPN